VLAENRIHGRPQHLAHAKPGRSAAGTGRPELAVLRRSVATNSPPAGNAESAIWSRQYLPAQPPG
jgi:hypothetical protein